MDKLFYDTKEAAVAAFERYQEQTQNKYVVYSAPKALKKTARPKVFWDNENHPFVVQGFKIFICSHGRDKNAKRKKKKSSKKAVENTEKVGCKAQITIKEILHFPQYKADKKRRSQSEVAGKVRRHLQDGRNRFMLLIDDNHTNHPVKKMLNKTGQDDGNTPETSEMSTHTHLFPAKKCPCIERERHMKTKNTTAETDCGTVYEHTRDNSSCRKENQRSQDTDSSGKIQESNQMAGILNRKEDDLGPVDTEETCASHMNRTDISQTEIVGTEIKQAINDDNGKWQKHTFLQRNDDFGEVYPLCKTDSCLRQPQLGKSSEYKDTPNLLSDTDEYFIVNDLEDFGVVFKNVEITNTILDEVEKHVDTSAVSTDITADNCNQRDHMLNNFENPDVDVNEEQLKEIGLSLPLNESKVMPLSKFVQEHRPNHEQIWELAGQGLSSLNKLHQGGRVHGHINPESLIVRVKPGGQPHLENVDAKQLEGFQALYYFSPEMCKLFREDIYSQTPETYITDKDDVFAFAHVIVYMYTRNNVLLNCLTMGELAKNSNIYDNIQVLQEHIMHAIEEEIVNCLIPDEVDIYMRELILWMLKYDYKERASSADALQFVNERKNVHKENLEKNQTASQPKSPLKPTINGTTHLNSGHECKIPDMANLLAEPAAEPVKSSTIRQLKRKLSKQQGGWQDQKVGGTKRMKTIDQARKKCGQNGGSYPNVLKIDPVLVKENLPSVQTFDRDQLAKTPVNISSSSYTNYHERATQTPDRPHVFSQTTTDKKTHPRHICSSCRRNDCTCGPLNHH